jgi:YbbR domain-containing protein
MVYHPFRHLGLKFLSVAVALGLWFTVAGEPTVERSVRVPLELTGWSEKLELVESPPAFVDVRVRGASGLLSTLSAGDVIATVDLSLAKEGRKFIYLTPSQVQAPPGVEVVKVTPSMVPLKFEKSMSKFVPVVPVVEGEPAAGYVAGTPSVEPTTVEVIGPESALQRFKQATTEPVSVTDRRSQVRAVVNIGLSEAGLRLAAPVTATVTVPIRSKPVDKVVNAVPVRVRNLRRGLSAQVVPEVVAVAVRGPKDVVDGLGPAAVIAFVDLAGRGPGRYNLSVRVELAQDVVVARTEPAVVRVRVQ